MQFKKILKYAINKISLLFIESSLQSLFLLTKRMAFLFPYILYNSLNMFLFLSSIWFILPNVFSPESLFLVLYVLVIYAREDKIVMSCVPYSLSHLQTLP